MRKNNKSGIFDESGTIPDINKNPEIIENLFNLIPELICIASADGYFKKLNPPWEITLGFTLQELMSKPFKEFIHPDDVEPTLAEIEKQFKGKKTINFTNRYLCKDGRYKTLNWVATPSPDQNLLYASARDITENIARDAELSALNDKYHALIENSSEAIIITLPDGRVTEANRAACIMLDYKQSEIVNLGRDGLVDLTDSRLPVLLKERDITGKARGELRFIKKGGIKFDAELSSSTIIDKYGDTRNIIIIRDITDRKKTEEKLKQSEEKWRTLFDLLPVGVSIIDKRGLISEFNKAQIEIFKMSAKGIQNREYVKRKYLDSEYKTILPEDLPYQKAVKEQKSIQNIEIGIIKENGETIWTEVSAAPLSLPDSICAIVTNDITKRKNAEEALRESEKRQKDILDHGGIGVAYWNLKGELLYLNERAVLNMGGKSEEQFVGKNFFELFGNELGKKYYDRVLQSAKLNEPVEYIEHVQIPDGPRWYSAIHTRSVNSDGIVTGVHIFAADITDIKMAEQQLKEAKEKYELLYTMMDEGVALNEAVVNDNGEIVDYIILDVNPAFEIQSPYTKVEALGRRATDLYKMSQDYIRNWWNEHSLHEKAAYTEMYHEPSQRWFEITTTLLEGMLFYTIFRDITMRKKSEEALRNSELKYRNLFESSLIGISATNLDGYLIQANQAYAKMYGYNTEEQMLKEANDIRTRYARPEERTKILKILKEKGRIGPMEVEVVKRDGSKIHVLITAHVVKDNDGKILYTQAEHIDITELKKLEEELKKSRSEMLELSLHIDGEREKERARIALDLHDELGQKLTALIMDVAWIKKKMTREMPEISDKLSSMSLLLNETLVDIQNISAGLRPSILDDLGLAAAIKWQIQKISESTELRFVLSIAPEEFTLPPDLSTLVFRVIQEALTNIVRHASAKEVVLKVLKKRDKLTVKLNDNGVGISPDKIKSPVSFGLMGIRERIKTQGGSFSIKGKHGVGTEIQIEIPLFKEYNSI